MYTVKGQMINAFGIPASEKYEESFKIQILGDTILKDGQAKKEMITLSVPMKVYIQHKDNLGKEIALPIAFFASNGTITPYYPKGERV